MQTSQGLYQANSLPSIEKMIDYNYYESEGIAQMKNQYVDTSNGMEFAVITLGDHIPDENNQLKYSQTARLNQMIQLGIDAEAMGYDVFGVGESHQAEFISSSPAVMLAAVGGQTKNIKLTSATTVLSLNDPVKVYEDFASLDQITGGRAEILLGRGSRHGAYQLFGYDIRDYDELFAEKLDLLQQLNTGKPVTWSGKYRSPLENADFYPKPFDDSLPLWRVVGQHTSSAKQAGEHGLPANFSYLWTGSNLFNKRVEIYRNALRQHQYDPNQMPIGISGSIYIADDINTAMRESYKAMQHTFKYVHGIDMNKQDFINARSYKHPMLIGDKQLLIDKIMYQYETFNFQRLTLEIDNGNHPEKVQQQLQKIADEVIPYVKTHTKS